MFKPHYGVVHPWLCDVMAVASASGALSLWKERTFKNKAEMIAEIAARIGHELEEI